MELRRIAAVALGLMTSATICAGPLVIAESARVVAPEPGFFIDEAGISGDSLIVSATKRDDDDNATWALYAFQRDSAGVWKYTQKLAQASFGNLYIPSRVTMAGNLAFASSDRLRAYERTASGWLERPISGPVQQRVADLAMNETTALAILGNCSWSAQPFRRSADGAWSPFGYVQGSTTLCGGFGVLEDGDLFGNRALIYNQVSDVDGHPDARIYEVGAAPPWVQVATLRHPRSPNARFGPSLALDGNTALVNGDMWDGLYRFDRDVSGQWRYTGDLVIPENLLGATQIEARNGLAFATFSDVDHRMTVASVFQKQSDGRYAYAAKLATSSRFPGDGLGVYIDVSGRRVVSSGSTGGAYIFDLPASFDQPAAVSQDFQSGSASAWSPSAGASFAVHTSGTARVYRQSSVGGDARSVLSTVDWKNQAIEADITPTYFEGADRWFGLIARYVDANNYYYVALRQSNVLELKVKRNGVFTTLASVPFPVQLNRPYRVRLEAIGSSIKAYVDGEVKVLATDDGLAQGKPGVMMYKTRADIDNVYVSPDHFSRYWSTTFFGSAMHMWTVTQGTWSNESNVFVQQSLAGDARALTGAVGRDQIVQARAMPAQFAPSAGSRWFGLISRYKDEGNFYYVTIRNSNEVSLRKLVNGQAQVIATAPFQVTLGQDYAVRLETVGTSLRVWIDGKLIAQGTDTTHTSGRFGFAAYKTSVRFDDLIAYDP